MSTLSDYSDRLFIALQEKLAETEELADTELARTQKAVDICNDSLNQLCAFAATYHFTGVDEEINFFKKIKPLFISELVYYAKIYQILVRWPVGDSGLHREYLRKAMYQFQQFFEDNFEFYLYQRINSSDRDHEYFVRNSRPGYSLIPAAFYIKGDPFSTGYDLQAAAILAFERLVEYLKNLLALNDHSASPGGIQLSTARTTTWTDDKIGLVELGYSIVEKGCCNNGNATLREVIAALEKAFNVRLTNYPRLWIIIRRRKTDRPSFLERLFQCLKNRIDKADE